MISDLTQKLAKSLASENDQQPRTILPNLELFSPLEPPVPFSNLLDQSEDTINSAGKRRKLQNIPSTELSSKLEIFNVLTSKAVIVSASKALIQKYKEK